MIRRTSNSKPPRKRCRGNLRPAPFFLTPATIGSIAGLSELPRPRIKQVPILPIELIDRPRDAVATDQFDWPDAPLPEGLEGAHG